METTCPASDPQAPDAPLITMVCPAPGVTCPFSLTPSRAVSPGMPTAPRTYDKWPSTIKGSTYRGKKCKCVIQSHMKHLLMYVLTVRNTFCTQSPLITLWVCQCQLKEVTMSPMASCAFLLASTTPTPPPSMHFSSLHGSR